LNYRNHTQLQRESRVQNNALPQMPCGKRPVVFSDAFPEKTTSSEPFKGIDGALFPTLDSRLQGSYMYSTMVREQKGYCK